MYNYVYTCISICIYIYMIPQWKKLWKSRDPGSLGIGQRPSSSQGQIWKPSNSIRALVHFTAPGYHARSSPLFLGSRFLGKSRLRWCPNQVDDIPVPFSVVHHWVCIQLTHYSATAAFRRTWCLATNPEGYKVTSMHVQTPDQAWCSWITNHEPLAQHQACVLYTCLASPSRDSWKAPTTEATPKGVFNVLEGICATCKDQK